MYNLKKEIVGAITDPIKMQVAIKILKIEVNEFWFWLLQLIIYLLLSATAIMYKIDSERFSF